MFGDVPQGRCPLRKPLESSGADTRRERKKATAARRVPRDSHTHRLPSWLRLKSAPEWTPTPPKVNSAGPCRWRTAPCTYSRVWMKLKWGKYVVWLLHVFYSLKPTYTPNAFSQRRLVVKKRRGFLLIMRRDYSWVFKTRYFLRKRADMSQSSWKNVAVHARL